MFNPLVEEAVAKLLARQSTVVQEVTYQGAEELPAPKSICFVGVENKSIEELGDFKDQIYQQIDTMLVQSQVFQPVSRRVMDAALRETRLRPDSLLIPENMRMFAAVLEQQGQPLHYLLYATITSGTTVAQSVAAARLPADARDGQRADRCVRQTVGRDQQGLPQDAGREIPALQSAQE